MKNHNTLFTCLIIFVILMIGLNACKKADVQHSAQIQARLGDPTKFPNLYIPENESGWEGGQKGLQVAYKDVAGVYINQALAAAYGIPQGTYRQALRYECLIANGIKGDVNPFPFETTRAKDFVVCRSCDGIRDSLYYGSGYQFPAMLSIKLYKDGELAIPAPQKRIKQSFFVTANEARKGGWQLPLRNYGQDTMYIPYGYGDLYYNQVLVPEENGRAIPGYYVLVVEINPDKEIVESDYTDNVSILPVYIGADNSITTDTNAIRANLPKAPTNFQGVVSWGKNKQVSLSWEGNSDHYHIYRDGVYIPSHDYYIYGNTFIDKTLPNGWRRSTYTIVAHNVGIGKSLSSTSITVER